MKMGLRRVLAALGCLAIVLTVALDAVWAADAAGMQDHPAVTRYPGSEIAWGDVQNFLSYAVATGPVTGYKTIDDWLELEGRVTRNYYELDGVRTHSEVFANYRQALSDAGFEILAEGHFPQSSQAAEVGSRKWLGVAYGRNPGPSSAGIRLLQGSATSGGSAFIAAKKTRAEGDIYVTVGIAQYSDAKVVYMIDVIEVDSVETGLVQIDAEAMGEDIDEFGKVALYGLYFDHDKASLQSESAPALEEIAKLLQGRPQLEVYVVGHSDSTGALDYNLKLSAARAQSVVDALVKDYGIATGRLEAQGVGPLVPVFTNRSEPGRGKNRRVELVER